MGRNLSVWDSITGGGHGTGLLPLNFFSPPAPFRIPRGSGAPASFWSVLVCVDSVRGSNSPLLVRSGVDSSELGDEIGDKAILRGIKGGYFKTSLLWGIVVCLGDR